MSAEVKLQEINPETCFVAGTHKGRGRRNAVAPGKTAARYLHYGRITLASNDAPLAFDNHGQETGLVCLNGAAQVSVADETFELARYDALYVPRDSRIEVRADGDAGCDLAEISAPVEHRYPLQFVRFADVRENPKLHVLSGAASAERRGGGEVISVASVLSVQGGIKAPPYAGSQRG